MTLAERTNAGLHEFLAREVTAVARDTPVLDLGCGTGAWLSRLAALGFTQLAGVDREASAFACPAARFIQADLDREVPDLGARRYGLVTAIEIVEHLESPGRLWHLVDTHLADDGCFLLTTPNVHSLNSRLRFLLTGELPAFDAKSDPTHVQPLYLEAARRVLSRHGLRVERTWTYPPHGSRVFRRAIAAASRLLGLALPDPHPGDNLCLEVRRAGRPER